MQKNILDFVKDLINISIPKQIRIFRVKSLDAQKENN